jgi:TonB family protein
VIRGHALPVFLLISVLAHGLAAMVLPGSAMPVPRPGTSLRVSLLPPNPHRIRQSRRGARGGHHGPASHSAMVLTAHHTRTRIRSSRSPRDAMARNRPGAASSSKVTAQVSASLQGSAPAQRLRRALARYFYYPELAIRYGWQGTVKIGVRLRPDGTVSRVRLVHSSGYAVLDDAALRSTRSIHSIGNLGAGSVHDFDVQLPVVYRLAES